MNPLKIIGKFLARYEFTYLNVSFIILFGFNMGPQPFSPWTAVFNSEIFRAAILKGQSFSHQNS